MQIPEKKRVFRFPAANILCPLAFYCCNLISYWTGWQTISKLDIAILIGMAFFMWAYSRGHLSQNKIGLKSLCWLAPYLIGLSLISWLGSFGGKNIIPFGWDFLVLGVFSLIILYLAVSNRAAISKCELEKYKAIV